MCLGILCVAVGGYWIKLHDTPPRIRFQGVEESLGFINARGEAHGMHFAIWVIIQQQYMFSL